MSFSVGELVAFLRLDDSQFQQALAAAPKRAQAAGSAIETSMTGAAKATDTVGASTGRARDELGRYTASATGAGAASTALGSKVGSANKAFDQLKKFAAGAVIVGYLKSSVDAASDLNETMSASKVVFGSAQKSIEDFGKGAAVSVGLSKQAAIEAANRFGDMFHQLGQGQAEAADTSKAVIKMAADLGSLKNLDTEDVLDRISGALRGEYDSLQLLIPNINATRVENEAMAATGKTSAAALTAQEKATATLAIVTKDGASAMGDFARTSDGFANSSKTAAARAEEAKAALGDKLLPVAQTLLALFTDVGIPALDGFGVVLGVAADAATPLLKLLGLLLTGVNSLPEPLKVAVISLTAFALLSGPLGKLGDRFDSVGGKAKKMGATIKAAVLDNPIGLALTAIVTAFSLFSSGAGDAAAAADSYKAHVDDLTASLDRNTGAATENTRTTVRDKLGNDKLRALEQLGILTVDYTDAILGNTDAQKKVQAQILATAEAAVKGTKAYQLMVPTLEKLGVTSEDLAKAALNQDWSSVAAAIDDYNAHLKAGEAPLLTLGGLQQTLATSTGSVRQAYTDLNGETQAVSNSQADFALQARATGTAVGDQADATKSAIQPAKDLSEAVQDEERAHADLETSVRNAIAALDEMQHRNDPTSAMDAAAAVRDYAAAYREQIGAQRDVAAAQDRVAESAETLKAAQDKAVDSTYTQEQKTRDVAAAQRDLDAATAGVQDAYDHLSDTGDDLYKSGEDVRKSFVEQATEARNAALATGKTMAEAHEVATAKVDELTKGLAAQLKQSGLTDEQVAAYIGTLGLVPDEVVTAIEADDRASGKIGDVNAGLVGLDGKKITVYIDQLTRSRAYGEDRDSTIREPGGYRGGQVDNLPRYFGGGQLPGVPPADPTADNLLMVGPDGLFRARSREWLIKQGSSDYYGPRIMSAINEGRVPRSALAGFASGGVPGGTSGTAASVSGAPQVNVYIDGQQLFGRVEVYVDGQLQELADAYARGRGQTL